MCDDRKSTSENSAGAAAEASRLAGDALAALGGLFALGAREAVDAASSARNRMAEAAAPAMEAAGPALGEAAEAAKGVLDAAGTAGALVLTGAAILLAKAAEVAVVLAESITPEGAAGTGAPDAAEAGKTD
jgi:hypothetical protein